jgi:aminobenzoyl-glutamate utilization protein B
VRAWLDEHGADFHKYSDAIWSYAELGCEETLSSGLLVQLLEKRGFSVRAGVAGMPTAFVAEWGAGSPTIGINCEYDALPGLSQQVGTGQQPVTEGAPGHGCGHNILGVGSVMAAVALKEWLTASAKPGRIRILGTPAEEVCIGKPFMARAGLFSGLDAVIDWHPWTQNAANYDTCNAYFNIKYHFSGRTAHGNAPWEGRSAVDSALLMGHALELLREHIPPGSPDAANTINYTFSNLGPEYPNVVPDRATIWVIGRITTSEEMGKIIQRIHKCAEGASLATGTSCKMEFLTATHEKIPNERLSAVMHRNLFELGLPRFDSEEQEFAKKMQRDVGVAETGLTEDVMSFQGGASGVSDNSEFSWFAPFAMLWMTAGLAAIGWHNWQVAACVRHTIGKKAMTSAAKVLATTGVDLMTQPQLLVEAKAEYAQRLAGKSYQQLIPADANPPIEINRKVMEKYRALMKKHYQNP